MSKASSKQRYIQLKEWLAVRKGGSTTNRKPKKKFSKADHYKSRGVK
tara:strand:+ start:6955 stop:7095 length:141 start_codon:yes stop_codon:yes gene_type:complete